MQSKVALKFYKSKHVSYTWYNITKISCTRMYLTIYSIEVDLEFFRWLMYCHYSNRYDSSSLLSVTIINILISIDLPKNYVMKLF